MKIIIYILIILQASYLFSKQDIQLNLLFNKIISSEGLNRTRLIDNLFNYPSEDVIEKTKAYLTSKNVEEKEAAAEVSGIFKDSSYNTLIEKELKKAKDFKLINSLIFSIGENKFHNLGNLLCKYINNEAHYKTAYFALIKLKDDSCLKNFNKLLSNGKSKDQLSILEFITKTKNKKYLKNVNYLFKKTKNSSVKYSSAIALLVLNSKVSIPYIKNYLNKELDSTNLKLNTYKHLETLLEQDNINTQEIFLNGVSSSDEVIKIFSIATLVKKNKYKALSTEDINFIENYSQSKDPNIFIYYSQYKRYLKINNIEEIKTNKNEDAKPF